MARAAKIYGHGHLASGGHFVAVVVVVVGGRKKKCGSLFYFIAIRRLPHIFLFMARALSGCPWCLRVRVRVCVPECVCVYAPAWCQI